MLSFRAVGVQPLELPSADLHEALRLMYMRADLNARGLTFVGGVRGARTMEADARSVRTLCERALAREDLSRDDIVTLLSLKDVRSLEILRQAAEEGLRRWVGDSVDILFRLAISSHCAHDCLYCDLRASNEAIERYRLSSDKVIEHLRTLNEVGYGTIVLDGAEDPSLEAEFMQEILNSVGENGRTPVLSLGERSRDYYSVLRDCGVERYLIDQRTASPILYNELHPEGDYFDRLSCIKTLLELGFSVGTSVAVGLPHQDTWDLADDLLHIAETGLDTIIIGPFIPGPTSPLSASKRGTIQASLNAMAVARLVIREGHIPAGLGLDYLDRGSSIEALRWGADSVVCNIPINRESAPLGTSPLCDSITTRIRSLGRSICTGHN